MKRLGKITGIFVMLALMHSCATKDSISSIDPKIGKELDRYSQKIKMYEGLDAHLVSPEQFKILNQHFAEAKKSAYTNSSFKEVSNILSKGKQNTKNIDKNIKLAQVHIPDVLKAREEASKENAQYLEIFKKADVELIELSSSLENRDINKAIENRTSVKEMFIAAEVQAIQDRDLKPAVITLSEAQSFDGHDNFFKEEDKAIRDIKSAAMLIKKFKDTPSRYAQAVMRAEHSTSKLFALTKTAEWIESKSTKDVVYKLHQDLDGALEPLLYGEADRISYSKKIELITKETKTIPIILNQLSASEYDSYMQEHKLSKLKQTNHKISNKLAESKEVQRKIDIVRSMFDEDNAKIFVHGDDLIVRLVGLNFAFNNAAIPTNSKGLLSKVGETAEALNYPDMKIIGHADAKGKALYNQKLSKKRAENVNNFLVKNTRIDQKSTYVQGAGFREPISENKTASGRKDNRRIDIVFNSVVK